MNGSMISGLRCISWQTLASRESYVAYRVTLPTISKNVSLSCFRDGANTLHVETGFTESHVVRAAPLVEVGRSVILPEAHTAYVVPATLT